MLPSDQLRVEVEKIIRIGCYSTRGSVPLWSPHVEAVDIDVFKLVASERRRCSVPSQRWLNGFEVLRRVVFSKEALEASSQKVVTAHEQFFFLGWLAICASILASSPYGTC